MKPLVLALSLLTTFTTLSQDLNVDFQQLMDETKSNLSKNDREMVLAWWLPRECWRAALEKEGFLTEEELDFFLKVLKPYTIVAVIDGSMNSKGEISYTPEPKLRKSIKLYDADGQIHRPMSNSDVNPELIVRLSMIKPLLNVSWGKWKDNFSFFIFDDVKAKNVRNFDPLKGGEIELKVVGKKFAWKTPLSALQVKPEPQPAATTTTDVNSSGTED